jgi:hypothetical protein
MRKYTSSNFQRFNLAQHVSGATTAMTAIQGTSPRCPTRPPRRPASARRPFRLMVPLRKINVTAALATAYTAQTVVDRRQRQSVRLWGLICLRCRIGKQRHQLAAYAGDAVARIAACYIRIATPFASGAKDSCLPTSERLLRARANASSLLRMCQAGSRRTGQLNAAYAS